MPILGPGLYHKFPTIFILKFAKDHKETGSENIVSRIHGFLGRLVYFFFYVLWSTKHQYGQLVSHRLETTIEGKQMSRDDVAPVYYTWVLVQLPNKKKLPIVMHPCCRGF